MMIERFLAKLKEPAEEPDEMPVAMAQFFFRAWREKGAWEGEATGRQRGKLEGMLEQVRETPTLRKERVRAVVFHQMAALCDGSDGMSEPQAAQRVWDFLQKANDETRVEDEYGLMVLRERLSGADWKVAKTLWKNAKSLRSDYNRASPPKALRARA